jgi:hypothetical protein
MRPPGRTRPQASGLEEIAASGPFGYISGHVGLYYKASALPPKADIPRGSESKPEHRSGLSQSSPARGELLLVRSSS